MSERRYLGMRTVMKHRFCCIIVPATTVSTVCWSDMLDLEWSLGEDLVHVDLGIIERLRVEPLLTSNYMLERICPNPSVYKAII